MDSLNWILVNDSMTGVSTIKYYQFKYVSEILNLYFRKALIIVVFTYGLRRSLMISRTPSQESKALSIKTQEVTVPSDSDIL